MPILRPVFALAIAGRTAKDRPAPPPSLLRPTYYHENQRRVDRHRDLAGVGALRPGRSLGAPERPDSIVYINVLEHVEDDQAELHIAHSKLASGGRILVFVPAHEWLMSRFDRRLGHYRRYTRESLTKKFEKSGFAIRFSAYFDVLGIFPWWLKYRVLQSEEMETSLVRAFDSFGVPLSRAFDSLTNFRIGKNVIVVGEKSEPQKR